MDGKFEYVKAHPHEDYAYYDGTIGGVIFFDNSTC